MVMTKTLIFKNNEVINKSEIPVLEFTEFERLITDTHFRVANLFINQEEYKNIQKSFRTCVTAIGCRLPPSLCLQQFLQRRKDIHKDISEKHGRSQ